MHYIPDGVPPTFEDGVSYNADVKARAKGFGRDPETFGLRLQVIPQITAGAVDLDATFETIPTLLDAGATHIEIAALNYVAGPDEFPDFVDACITARDKNS